MSGMEEIKKPNISEIDLAPEGKGIDFFELEQKILSEDAKVVEHSINNPESIKDLSLPDFADLLNKANINDVSKHPLKKIIFDIINGRYNKEEGWKNIKVDNGLEKTKGNKKTGIKKVWLRCNLDNYDHTYVWGGGEKEE